MSFQSQLNHHFLMSLVKKSTDISTVLPSYKNYADLLTTYAFNHLQGQTEKMEFVKVPEQMNQEKYRLKNH